MAMKALGAKHCVDRPVNIIDCTRLMCMLMKLLSLYERSMHTLHNMTRPFWGLSHLSRTEGDHFKKTLGPRMLLLLVHKLVVFALWWYVDISRHNNSLCLHWIRLEAIVFAFVLFALVTHVGMILYSPTTNLSTWWAGDPDEFPFSISQFFRAKTYPSYFEWCWLYKKIYSLRTVPSYFH